MCNRVRKLLTIKLSAQDDRKTSTTITIINLRHCLFVCGIFIYRPGFLKVFLSIYRCACLQSARSCSIFSIQEMIDHNGVLHYGGHTVCIQYSSGQNNFSMYVRHSNPKKPISFPYPRSRSDPECKTPRVNSGWFTHLSPVDYSNFTTLTDLYKCQSLKYMKIRLDFCLNILACHFF